MKCWGANAEGQLGLGDTTNRGQSPSDMGDDLPLIDSGGHKALQISANASNTCAILDNQSLVCWGDNFFGQLGVGNIQNVGDAPNEMGANLVAVSLGTGQIPKAVASGGAFTCTLLQSGQVKCWGETADNGILGANYCQDSNGDVGLCSMVTAPPPERLWNRPE